jgi:uncharacterized protein YjbI with pentapeptide repeats
MEDEEFLPRMEVEELLRRYAAGERRFIQIDLSGADLSELDFGRKGGKGIIYNERINFAESNLKGANFSGTNLTGVMFYCAILDRAILDGAILECANFENASLIDASLVGSNLNSSTLAGADLTNANLTGAKGGFGVKDATFCNTILPDGTIRNEPY